MIYSPITLKIKKLHPDAIVPTRGSVKASGLDLYALEDTKIYPGHTVLVKTGIAFGIPEGYEIQVRPRSGLSLKTSLRVANSPGTVDADYTGECAVILTDIRDILDRDFERMYGPEADDRPLYHIKRGDRIAQAVLCPVIIPELEMVDDLGQTDRGAGGFGSTGK